MSGLLSSAYVVGFNFKHFVIVIFMFKFTDNVFGGFLVMSLSGFDIRLLLASQSQQGSVLSSQWLTPVILAAQESEIRRIMA
jgi:hypothetical protein